MIDMSRETDNMPYAFVLDTTLFVTTQYQTLPALSHPAFASDYKKYIEM